MSSGHQVLITPDATLLSTGYTVQFGGGAANPGTHHAALADELPQGTKVSGVPYTRINDTSAVAAGDFRCSFGTYTLEANERCRRVRARFVADTRTARYRVGLGNGATTAEPLGRAEIRPLPGGVGKVVSIIGPWASKAQDGAGLATLEWTQTNLNDLRARITPISSHFLGTSYWYKLRAELDIAAKAEPIFVSPFEDEVYAVPTPTLRWDKGSSDAQKKYQLRIFPADVAEDDTFDVTTSTAYIYQVTQATTQLSHRVTAGILEHGKFYYAYVKVATDFNGEDWWSDYSPGVVFKINAKPEVTVISPPFDSDVVDTAKPIVQWTYEDDEGDLQSAFRVVVLQKPVNGWGADSDIDPNQESLNGNAIFDSGIITSEVSDFAIPVGLQNATHYRAYVMVRQRQPSVLDSDWAYTQFETLFIAPPVSSLELVHQTDTTTDILVSPGVANLLPTADDSSFEGGIGQWVAGVNVTLAQNVSNGLDGTDSLGITKTVAGGNADAFSDNNTDACVPLRPGQSVSAMVWIKALTTTRSCTLSLQFLDLANAIISTVVGSAVTDSTSTWTKLVVIGTAAPANTIKVRLRIQVGSASVGEVHVADKAMLYQGTGNPEWNLGGGTPVATLGPEDAFSTFTRNLLTPNQSSLETDTTGWAAWDASTTIVRENGFSSHGNACLRMTRNTTTGDARATTPRAPGTIPCKPGLDYTVMGDFQAVTTGRVVAINFEFFDQAASVIPHVVLDQALVADITGSWTPTYTRALAPPNAHTMSINVVAMGAVATEQHRVDRMAIMVGEFTNPAVDWSVGDAHTMDVVDARITVGAYLLDWTPPEPVILAHRWDFIDDRECSWIMWLLTDGKIMFQWSTDGTEGMSKSATSTLAPSPAFVNGSLHYIRVDFDNDNGAAGQNVHFFHGTTLAGATTAIGVNPVTVADVEPIYNGFAEFKIGGQGFGTGGWQGYAVEAELRNAMGGGTLEANPIFNIVGLAEFRDTPGRLWVAVNNAEMELKEKPNPDFFNLERSRDGGETWEWFRYDDGSVVSNRIPGTLELFSVRDHEIPLNRELKYRISAITDSLGFDTNSAWSAEATITIPGKLVTLKDTKNPDSLTHFPVADTWLEGSHTRNRQVFQPVGRNLPIVIRGYGQAERFSMTFTLLGDKFEELMSVVDSDNLLFLQTPSRSWWVEIATDVDFRQHLWGALRNDEDLAQVTIPFIEVDRLDESFVASIIEVS